MEIYRCQCGMCSDKDSCQWADKLQRLPRKHGGLGLCPRLKTGSDPTSYAKIDVPMKGEDK